MTVWISTWIFMELGLQHDPSLTTRGHPYRALCAITTLPSIRAVIHTHRMLLNLLPSNWLSVLFGTISTKPTTSEGSENGKASILAMYHQRDPQVSPQTTRTFSLITLEAPMPTQSIVFLLPTIDLTPHSIQSTAQRPRGDTTLYPPTSRKKIRFQHRRTMTPSIRVHVMRAVM